MVQQNEQTQQALAYARHQAAKGIADLAALMRRTAEDCARCLEGVSEQQARFRPPAGTGPTGEDEWSITDVLAHIIDSTATVNREIAGLVKGKPPAPVSGIGVTPGDDRPIEEIRRSLADLWDETARLVASLPEDASLEPTRAHPWFGPLNFREWIAFQRLHALDHVQQIEKVKAAPGYPNG